MNEYDITYFDWLCDIVGISSKKEYDLASVLFDIPYRYHFVMDKNRAEAGKLLRKEYMDISGMFEEDMPEGDCSVFEMFVALARRFNENTTDISVEESYSIIIHNLGLNKVRSRTDIYKIVDDFMDGVTEGPYPLMQYGRDSRDMELWDAMKIYISYTYPHDPNWLNN